jgi:hypothetical protein
MFFTIAITTFNPISLLRTDMLRRTMQSLDLAFPAAYKILFDNDSTDLSYYYFQELMVMFPKWTTVPSMSVGACVNHTPGNGRNQIMRYLRARHLNSNGEHIVVFSDDDITWSLESKDILTEFWMNAPSDLVILGGLLEDEYLHNTPRKTIECGSVKALIRDSTPGASWSFNYNDWWAHIGPVVNDFGYDTKCCKALKKEKGLRVAQMDLVEHIGYGGSTHGNEQAMWTRPLDRDKWGV